MLTLVIPVYNMEAFLERCMGAMLAQECRDFEIVLVDDGSTDRSGLLCDGYAAAHPGRIRVIHKPNGGLPSARNAGIDAARGEYISFPDPDDWVEPDYVARLLALQKAHDADMVCTGYFVATDEGSVPVYPDAEAAVLSGKRAQRELMAKESGEVPVLLLDDVLSELDPGRQDFVLNQIDKGQVFITCCEPGRFTKLGQTIEIKAGQVL